MVFWHSGARLGAGPRRRVGSEQGWRIPQSDLGHRDCRYPGVCRLTHGQVLSMREREFVLAAQTVGANSLRVMLRHILPTYGAADRAIIPRRCRRDSHRSRLVVPWARSSAADPLVGFDAQLGARLSRNRSLARVRTRRRNFSRRPRFQLSRRWYPRCARSQSAEPVVDDPTDRDLRLIGRDPTRFPCVTFVFCAGGSCQGATRAEERCPVDGRDEVGQVG